jgi:TP901 family phage tail tape measure protein
MAGFNLTAQIQLQAPTNVSQVANQIKSQLGNVTTTVNVQSNAKSLAAINGQLQSVDKTAKNSAKSMNLLNRNIAEAARRFSVITVATGAFIGMARAIKNSVGAAIEFEREMVKISQVTGKSVKELKGLSDEVTRISTTMGVANASLLETARVLSQAGLSALKTKQAMEVLANTTLAPSFDNIIDTTEGAIAILNQFGREAAKTGQDIRFLEASLDAINAVSKNFAVESADLIGAIRRTGGVFQAAGGNLNELIALFTSVRQTTRESAETIATGFRTIFTRLQRTETIDALEQLGISLSDAEGKFIGPLKAVEALAAGLAGLDPKDVRFNEIVEQLGGFRQIGKVIPLIKQYAVAEQALAVANNSMGSTSKDAQTAQQSLAVQFQKVAESFDALMRKFTGSDTFQSIAKTVLSLADAFLGFAASLENVLPLLTAVAAIKLGKNLAPGLVSLFGGGGGGGSVSKFARGGFVPGAGNRDTVPAMLTPGEFVIKKSSAAKLGAAQLHAMNENRFNDGAEIREELSAKRKAFKNVKGIKGKGSEGASVRLVEELSDDIKAKLESGEMNTYTGAFLRPEGRDKQVMGKLGKGVIGASIKGNERIAALKTAAKKKGANSVVKEAR